MRPVAYIVVHPSKFSIVESLLYRPRRKAPAFRHGDIRRKLAVDAKPQKV